MSNLPEKLKPWFEARKRYRLSHEHVQMARELGLNPKKFGSLANHKQELWKQPLPEFIARIYEQRFHRSRPEVIRSLEDLIRLDKERRIGRADRKAEKRLDGSKDAPVHAPDSAAEPSAGEIGA